MSSRRFSCFRGVLGILGACSLTASLLACGDASGGGGADGGVPDPGASDGGMSVSDAGGSGDGGRGGDSGKDSGGVDVTSLSVTAPSAVSVGRLGPVPIAFKVARGGVTSPIVVRLEGLPAGFTSAPVTLDPSSSDGELALAADASAASTPVNARISATPLAGAAASIAIVVRAERQKVDTTFGSAGVVKLTNRIEDVLPLPSGRLLLTGTKAGVGGGYESAAVQLLDASGAPDPAFATAGTYAVNVPGCVSSMGRSVVPKGDGSYYVLAQASCAVRERAVLIHLSGNGILDTSFGNAGYAILAATGFSNTWSSGLAIQSDGKLLVSAIAREGSSASDPKLAAALRVLPSGQLDASFGTGGVLSTGFGSAKAEANGIRVLSGAIYLYGKVSQGAGKLVRLSDTGTIDETFGASGIATVPFRVQDVLLTPAGKLLLPLSDTYSLVTQLTSLGVVDTTFGNDGMILATSPLPEAGYVYDSLPSVVFPDGKVSVFLSSSTNDRLELWSFDASGIRDATFGGTGSIRTSAADLVPKVLRQTSDGRLVAVANSISYPTPATLVRYFP